MDPDEGLEKLEVAFNVCNKYRATYDDRKAHLADYFKDKPVAEWDFESGLVFTRLDQFTGQLRMIEVRERWREGRWKWKRKKRIKEEDEWEVEGDEEEEKEEEE